MVSSSESPQRIGDDRRSPVGERLVTALRAYVDESEMYVAAARRDGEMHRTDLMAIAALLTNERDQQPPMTPGRLSQVLDLSPAATSAMLDRLEEAGHVTRSANPADRRSVVVQSTEQAHRAGMQMFSPLREHMTALLAEHDDAALEQVAAFLEAASAATRDARAELRDGQRRAGRRRR